MTFAALSPLEDAGSNGLVGRVTAIARTIRLFLAKQAQLAEFRRLDQHMLDDIGVVRADIDGVVEVMFRDRYAS
jgi:uncharacterized protein YjiS (DUF1127 family)